MLPYNTCSTILLWIYRHVNRKRNIFLTLFCQLKSYIISFYLTVWWIAVTILSNKALTDDDTFRRGLSQQCGSRRSLFLCQTVASRLPNLSYFSLTFHVTLTSVKSLVMDRVYLVERLLYPFNILVKWYTVHRICIRTCVN